MTNLCLGTVQFGMKYGVNNQIGRQPTWEESFEMLECALESGIDTIDTARAYGEAELILGKYFSENTDRLKGVKIVSKLRPNCIDWEQGDVKGQIRREFEDSLVRLGVDELDGYLLHTPEYVYNLAVVNAIVTLKEESLTKNIGVSIYDIKEGFAAIKTGVMDIVQLPYSVLDQRGSRSNFLAEAKRAGMKVATRSAFLQGLFMMENSSIPEHLKEAIPHIETLRSLAEKHNLDLVSAIMGFVAAEKDIDYLVFGVEKMSQLKEDIDKFEHLNIPEEFVNDVKEQIGSVDESIIFPSLWSNGKKAD